MYRSLVLILTVTLVTHPAVLCVGETHLQGKDGLVRSHSRRMLESTKSLGKELARLLQDQGLKEHPTCGCPYALTSKTNRERFPESATWTQSPRVIPSDASLADMLKQNAVHKDVLIMMTNYAEVDLVENYICSLYHVGMNKYVIIATDRVAHLMLLVRGYTSVYSPDLVGDLPLEGGQFNSGNWKALVRAKLEVVTQVLDLGFNIFFTDVDIVWKENVMYDVTKGLNHSSVFLLDRDPAKKRNSEANTGFYYLKAHQKNRDLVGKALSLGKRKEKSLWDDQKLVNFAFKSRNFKEQRNLMPQPEYSNGCMLKTLESWEEVRRVKALHANCSINKKAKFMMLCLYDMWYCKKNEDGTIVRDVGEEEFRTLGCEVKDLPEVKPEVVEEVEEDEDERTSVARGNVTNTENEVSPENAPEKAQEDKESEKREKKKSRKEKAEKAKRKSYRYLGDNNEQTWRSALAQEALAP